MSHKLSNGRFKRNPTALTERILRRLRGERHATIMTTKHIMLTVHKPNEFGVSEFIFISLITTILVSANTNK